MEMRYSCRAMVWCSHFHVWSRVLMRYRIPRQSRQSFCIPLGEDSLMDENSSTVTIFWQAGSYVRLARHYDAHAKLILNKYTGNSWEITAQLNRRELLRYEQCNEPLEFKDACFYWSRWGADWRGGENSTRLDSTAADKRKVIGVR